MTEPARACVRARARVLCAVRCALHVHVPFAWCSLLVAAGARLPADPCCSQRWRLTPRFASSAQAQCAGVAGAAIVAGAVAWPTSPPGLWRALVLWQLFYRFSAPSASLYWNVSRGAFTTSPHGPEFAAGSGFECRSHGATNLGFLPHSTLVGLTRCSCSRSLSLVCLSVRARGLGRRCAVRRAVHPTSPSVGCRRPTPPPRRCCCRCCHRRCCRCRW